MVNSEINNILRPIIPLSDGGSFKLMYDMLYNIARLKYVRQSQLKLINKRYEKICAKDKLDYLTDKKLLIRTYQDVYTASKLTIQFLEDLKHPVDLLPSVAKGLGDINELHNTAVFIQALKLPLFKALLFPQFVIDNSKLIPDALLVLCDKEKYKLIFLEVEASKSNWDSYIDNKRTNYIKLASDLVFFNYWLGICDILKLKPPTLKDLKFSVLIVGKIKRDFGVGFNFVEGLNFVEVT